MLPKEVHPGVANEVSLHLDSQLTGAVDAGNDRFVIDLTNVGKATLSVIELVLSAIQACASLSLKYAIVGPEALRTECRGFEEAQSWLFANTVEEAMAS
jgi:hypothetical protein